MLKLIEVNVLSVRLLAGGLCARRYAGRNQIARSTAAGRRAEAVGTGARHSRVCSACYASCYACEACRASKAGRSRSCSVGFADDRKAQGQLRFGH